MSGINQDIKSGPFNPLNTNNPHNLYEFIKPSRILALNRNPTVEDGTLYDYWINSSSADFFTKTSSGEWFYVYNFNNGGGSGGISAIENNGSGEGTFKEIIGNTAHFKSLIGTTDEIDLIDLTDEIQIAMNANYKPVTLNKVGNFPLQVALGSGVFSPNGLLGEPDYNRGSLFVQVGTSDILWICNDPALKVWLQLSFNGEVLSIENLAGAGSQVFAQTTAEGIAQLRRISGVVDNINVTTSPDFITVKVSDTYKPLTLDKVENVKNVYGEATVPTAFDDSSVDFQVGSIWTTATQTYLCGDATVGAAVWKLTSDGGTALLKDYKNWRVGTSGYTQTINYNFADMNFGPGAPIVSAGQTPSSFSSLQDGTRQVFRRAPVLTAKSYMGYINVLVEDFAGSTTDASSYDIIMIRKSGGVLYSQSLTSAQLPAQDIPNRKGTISATWLFDEPNLTQEDYYFQIRGRVQTVGTVTAPNININEWSVFFKEL